MANFQLSYSGSEINGWGQRIATLENQLSSSNQNIMIFGQRVTISLNQCNTTYISACNGFYETWGPFVYVAIGLGFSTAIPDQTMITLINPGTFPTPEPNSSDPTQGYMPLSQNRETFPYVRYDGSLYISGSSKTFGTANLFINGLYRRQIT